MDGGLLNGKVFRYVHHYMSEQCSDVEGLGGGGGWNKILHMCA